MELIESIIHTLNQIEVKGKDNLDKLLGAIMALEMIANADKTTEEAEEKGE